MTMNGAVLPIMALYIVAAEEQGVPPAKLAGTIQNDVLKEFMVRNTYIYPPGPSMRIVADIFAYTARRDAQVQLDLDLRLPHAGSRAPRSTSSSPTPWPTGSNTCAPASPPAWTSTRSPPRLSFFWNAGMNSFMEMAKQRAARLLVGRADGGQVRAQGSALADAARPHPDQRLVPGGAGRVQQRAAHDHRGAWPRWPARPRACTPTRSTRRSRCRPTSPPASPATPSSSCSWKPGRRAPSIPGAAPITSSG